MTDQDKTVGEIGRSVDRIEDAVSALAAQLQAVLTLTAAHSVRIDKVEREQDQLTTKVESLATRSAFISGGIAAGGAIVNFLLGRHA